MLLLSVVVELVEGDVGPRGRPARLLQPLPHHPRRNAVRILKDIDGISYESVANL